MHPSEPIAGKDTRGVYELISPAHNVENACKHSDKSVLRSFTRERLVSRQIQQAV
ncbi:hypothetical protein Pla22_16740 [Rubripirellula amarantea]|uniref:Uncharacterized protein n=1 Tax=Rubripirellula amarantea TaxID=2527999 RepID=A0A5C5WUV9_9BACT|nr:hypothetical protein Pla22_16740 [Rubripirellula amarantea]